MGGWWLGVGGWEEIWGEGGGMGISRLNILNNFRRRLHLERKMVFGGGECLLDFNVGCRIAGS